MPVIGSSPPARGLLPSSSLYRAHAGLIPACAGTTFSGRRLCADYEAHPRLRGDYHMPAARSGRWAGSSPPARGLHCSAISLIARLGLIPACEGTTEDVFQNASDSEAHPRLRGDYRKTEYLSPIITGSSPPARGLLVVSSGHILPIRLIPACAGTTRQENMGAWNK